MENEARHLESGIRFCIAAPCRFVMKEDQLSTTVECGFHRGFHFDKKLKVRRVCYHVPPLVNLPGNLGHQWCNKPTRHLVRYHRLL